MNTNELTDVPCYCAAGTADIPVDTERGVRRQEGPAPCFLGAGILNQPLHPGSSETHAGKLRSHSAQGPATRNSKDASWEQIFLKISQMTLKEARVENHCVAIPRRCLQNHEVF